MPIDPSQYTDKDQRRFSLPMDSCVGDDGPEPAEVTMISTGRGPSSGLPATLALSGGSLTAGGARGKANAQTGGGVPVGFDPDYTTDDNYVR